MTRNLTMLVDSTVLARETFQCCRHLFSCSNLLLNALIPTLAQVQQSGALVVEIPESWLSSQINDAFLKRITQAKTSFNNLEVEQIYLSQLSKTQQQLLSLIEIAAGELKRLWLDRKAAAVQSLGYALHCIPPLVRGSDKFKPESYRFCFKIVAFVWEELSEEMQQAFCELMGLERDRAEQLVYTEGFVIDMYGYKQNGQVDRFKQIADMSDD